MDKATEWFWEEFLTDEQKEEILAFISLNYEIEEVFNNERLESWAEENNYQKSEEITEK